MSDRADTPKTRRGESVDQVVHRIREGILMDDTIARCRRHMAAGADAIFVDAPTSEADLVAIAGALRGSGKPLVFNSARTGKSPVLDERRLAEPGYPIVLYPIEAMLAAQRAVAETMRAIMDAGSTHVAVARMSTFEQVDELVDLAGHVARGARGASAWSRIGSRRLPSAGRAPAILRRPAALHRDRRCEYALQSATPSRRALRRGTAKSMNARTFPDSTRACA